MHPPRTSVPWQMESATRAMAPCSKETFPDGKSRVPPCDDRLSSPSSDKEGSRNITAPKLRAENLLESVPKLHFQRRDAKVNGEERRGMFSNLPQRASTAISAPLRLIPLSGTLSQSDERRWKKGRWAKVAWLSRTARGEIAENAVLENYATGHRGGCDSRLPDAPRSATCRAK